GSKSNCRVRERESLSVVTSFSRNLWPQASPRLDSPHSPFQQKRTSPFSPGAPHGSSAAAASPQSGQSSRVPAHAKPPARRAAALHRAPLRAKDSASAPSPSLQTAGAAFQPQGNVATDGNRLPAPSRSGQKPERVHLQIESRALWH